MVSIAAGELDKRVTVRRINETVRPDAAGHIDETNEVNWRNVCKRWCQILPRGSREFFRGQQVAEEITHQITMRCDSESRGFTTKMQLVLGSRRFNLAGPGVNAEEADVLLRFPAIEVF